MGFLQAMQQMGQSEKKEGLEPYLVRPMDQDGKEVRVWLQVKGDLQEILDVVGVSRIDLADYKANALSLKKYIYKKAPSQTTSSFSPIHPAGRMKNNAEQNRAAFCPPQWEDNKNTHFFKIKNRILNDYEREGVFSAGSVERILQGMQKKIDMVLPDLDNRQSYIVIFVVEHNGDLLYPGEVPALVKYFERKLKNSLSGGKKAAKKPAGTYQNCSICGKDKSGEVTLDKVFKFATFDKVSVLAGLDKKEIPYSFSICLSCFEHISSGREKVDRILTKRGLLPDILVWAMPEAVGHGEKALFEKFLYSWEEKLTAAELAGTGEKTEENYFSRLAKIGQGMVFHFVFWEKNNSQEIVHLMVEDVPPERLALLETAWQKVTREFAGWHKDTDLDIAMKSLYKTMSAFAGKSSADKIIFRDFALKVIGNMLQGEVLPVDTFKQLIVPRLPRLVFEGDSKKAGLSMRYAELWVEYMNRLNQEVSR
jgi:CRISPR-associated protein Csh1